MNIYTRTASLISLCSNADKAFYNYEAWRFPLVKLVISLEFQTLFWCYHNSFVTSYSRINNLLLFILSLPTKCSRHHLFQAQWSPFSKRSQRSIRFDRSLPWRLVSCIQQWRFVASPLLTFHNRSTVFFISSGLKLYHIVIKFIIDLREVKRPVID